MLLTSRPSREGAGPDGSFVSTRACNLRVPGANPGRDGYLSSRLCINSALNCSKAWSVQYCLWHCALYRVLEVIRNKSRAESRLRASFCRDNAMIVQKWT